MTTSQHVTCNILVESVALVVDKVNIGSKESALGRLPVCAGRALRGRRVRCGWAAAACQLWEEQP